MPRFEDAVGGEIRRRRTTLGLTQARLAEAVGVSTELVSRIERGRCLPSVPTLVELSRALSCSPNDLLGFGGSRRTSEAEAVAGLVDSLPVSRRQEILNVAEALAGYRPGNDKKEDK